MVRMVLRAHYHLLATCDLAVGSAAVAIYCYALPTFAAWARNSHVVKQPPLYGGSVDPEHTYWQALSLRSPRFQNCTMFVVL